MQLIKYFLKETTSEHSQKIQILEAEVAAKTEDLQRFKRLNEKQYRQLIAQEEKGTKTFFSMKSIFCRLNQSEKW